MGKRVKPISLLLALSLTLSACGGGGGQAASFDPETTCEALLDSGAFSTQLEELEPALLYDFEGYGLEEGAVTGGLAYSASGLTEQVAVLKCRDEAAAEETEALLETYLADAKTAFADYAPAEAGKLENAILERREDTVLLVVPNDADAAEKAVDALKEG